LMAKVLLVEDNPELSLVLTHVLSRSGFTVQAVPDGNVALDVLRVNKYDVIVLDWMMPGLSGIDVCRQLRSSGNHVPILMLTAKASDDDTETGLDAGADDYLTKPFANKVLAARLRALLRRPPQTAKPVMKVADITWDPAAGCAYRGDEEIHLRPMLGRLFEFFLRHPNQFFTAESLLERVWSDDSSAALETVRAHIKLLRKAVGSSLIETERHRGYRLRKE